MRKPGLFLGAGVVVAIAVLCVAWFFSDTTATTEHGTQKETISTMRRVAIDSHIVKVGLAQTPEERRHGLSGRAGLAADEGLLFVFESEGKWGFWMKDMRFSIDILWIGRDGRVVFIKENATPESYPESFVPDRPALYVLELPAGYCASHNVSVGSIVGL